MMADRPRIRVVAPSPSPYDTRIYLAYGDSRPDVDISSMVASIELEASGEQPWVARITTPPIVEVQRIDDAEPQWVGLDHVPLEALQAEINRREAEFFLAGAGLDEEAAGG